MVNGWVCMHNKKYLSKDKLIFIPFTPNPKRGYKSAVFADVKVPLRGYRGRKNEIILHVFIFYFYI